MDHRTVEQFLYREARIQDEHRYKDWEALWTKHADALYWVPAMPQQSDDEDYVSYIHDNRTRLASRIRQLETGTRIAQVPPSHTSRIISNICIESDTAESVVVTSKFILMEYRTQPQLWGGGMTHKLREEDGVPVIFFKRVDLVNTGGPLPTMAFLL